MKPVVVKQQTGFNLIELMVVMAIIGLLASMGWKMFTEQGRTNNRTDAILATNAVSLALTQFQSDNTLGFVWSVPPGAVTAPNAHNRYLPLVVVGPASDGSTFDNTCSQQRGFRWAVANARYESCRGFYFITVIPVDADGNGVNEAFTITTTAIVGRPQENDFECNSFTLNNNGVKGHIAIDDPLNPGVGPVSDQAIADPLNAAPTADGQFHSTRRCWGSD